MRHSLLILIATAGIVHAGEPCRTVAHPTTYAAPIAYAVPTLVLPAVFVPTPSYTVGLSAPADDGRLDEILRRLDSMDAARPLASRADGATVLATSCSKCHSVDAAKGGFTLGDVAMLDAAAKRKILDQILSGKMPPGQPLDSARRAAVLDAIVK